MIYAVIACCFRKQGRDLCPTVYERLTRTLNKYEPGDKVIVTGDVPYRKGSSTTMAELMRAHLLSAGIPGADIYIGSGVGIFSESESVTNIAMELAEEELTVVSSSWYLLPGLLIWTEEAKKKGLNISFLPVSEHGGIRTQFVYLGYAGCLYLSRWFKLEKPFRKVLEIYQSGRTEEFQWEGCK